MKEAPGEDTTGSRIALLDWKRRVFGLYAEVRRAADPLEGWKLWRVGRDELFRHHPQSPLPAARRASFKGLDYFPYDPALRVAARVTALPPIETTIASSSDGTMLFERFAAAHFSLADTELALELYWLNDYGSGLFVSFRDATSGSDSYGGGRYLLDTVKGADLGSVGDELVFDFNFAYNPSCAYDPRWSCPLSTPANRLPLALRAGERLPPKSA